MKPILHKRYNAFLLLCLILCCSCYKTNRTDSNPFLSEIIEDYHQHYVEHWGEKSKDDSLQITACFFQLDKNVFIALSGCPFRLHFYWSEETNGIRSDMLGYCRLGKNGLGVFDSVETEMHSYIEPYLQGLIFEDAQEIFDRQLYAVPNEYFDFLCIYHINKKHEYCLVDSGYYYQLKYPDFEYDF